MYQGYSTNDNFGIIDEKRKIQLNARNMNRFQQVLYTRSTFNNYRPDLSASEYFIFNEKLKLGEGLLNEYRKRLNNEIRRISILFPYSFHREIINHQFADQLLDLSVPHIRGNQSQAIRTWEDATKIVNWLDKKLLRIQKYGLDYPTLNKNNGLFECVSRENDVYERFVREMRKPPAQQQQE